MEKKRIKKILLRANGIFLLLVVVLCIHIYMVTRPKAPSANTLVMARIDIKQPITQADASKITEWMYAQKGVEHVVCNPDMDNVIFTYYPLATDGNKIADNFKTAMNYSNAIRYIPTEKEMQGGCPVAATSMTYKVVKFFRHTF